MATKKNSKITVPVKLDVEQPSTVELEYDEFDYSKRSQWLRAAVLGANDRLVSTASLMMGVGAVKQDIKAMTLSGFAGLVAGACSMAIGELVSVYSRLDIEVAQIKRGQQRVDRIDNDDREFAKSFASCSSLGPRVFSWCSGATAGCIIYKRLQDKAGCCGGCGDLGFAGFWMAGSCVRKGSCY